MNQRIAVAVVMTVIGLVVWVTALERQPQRGNFPFDVSTLARCGANVSPEDATAGLRVGDQLQLGRMPPAQRAEFLAGYVHRQTAYEIPVLRDGRLQRVRVVPSGLTAEQQRNALVWLSVVGAWLFCGVLALWFGRDAASLFGGLFLVGTSFSLGAPIAAGVSSLFDIVSLLLASADIIGFGALYLLTEELAGPELQWRGLLRAVVGLSFITGIGTDIAAQWWTLQAGCELAPANSIEYGCAFAIVTCAVVGMAFAVFGADRERRQRARWIFWSSALGMSGPFIAGFLQLAHVHDPTNGYIIVTVAAIPAGYTVASLFDRSFDVEFVANRAIVYVLMIVTLVTVFILVKRLLTSFVVGLGGLASSVFDLSVTIATALSLRAAESKIQKAVERVLFRGKYDAVVKLQQFGTQTMNFEHRRALLEAVAGTIQRCFAPTWVVVYVRSSDRYVPLCSIGERDFSEPLDADDPAFVALRTTGALLDLVGANSAIAADGIVVPMTIGGRLIGAIACGPRRNREVYDPDERDALGALATNVAVALFALTDRAREQFVGAVAAGTLNDEAARMEARRLLDVTPQPQSTHMES